jgi:RAB protein geranylgeranyltransferase component A
MAFVTVLQSYDPTTHFETTVQDVLSMYTRITGKVSFLSFPSFSTVDDSRI